MRKQSHAVRLEDMRKVARGLAEAVEVGNLVAVVVVALRQDGSYDQGMVVDRQSFPALVLATGAALSKNGRVLEGKKETVQ